MIKIVTNRGLTGQGMRADPAHCGMLGGRDGSDATFEALTGDRPSILGVPVAPSHVSVLTIRPAGPEMSRRSHAATLPEISPFAAYGRPS
jgi:hypothetical protein